MLVKTLCFCGFDVADGNDHTLGDFDFDRCTAFVYMQRQLYEILCGKSCQRHGSWSSAQL